VTATQSEALDLSPARFGRGIPFDAFARLRREAPVHWHEPDNCWVVTTYEHVRAINRDTARFSSAGGPTPQGQSEFAAGVPDGPERVPSMLFMDPPEHTRYRRIVNRAWVPRAVEPLGETIRRITREALDAFVGNGGGDFVVEVAVPIAFRVIAEMIGMPRDDERRVLDITNRLVPSDDPEYRPTPNAAARAAVEEAEYADELIAAHRRVPSDDLIGQLLDARIDGRPLTDAELREFVLLYLNGGTETSRHLFAHGVLALIAHPDQRRLVVDGEVDMAAAVDEMLRWSTPVMHHSRWPVEAVEIAGRRIEPGQRTTLWMVSANRDETVFDDPDAFDVRRRGAHHASFGSGGPHYCLGAHLSRIEAAILFDELRGVIDRFELAGAPERLRSSMFNGLKHLPIRIAP
jgi:cholest-4-en-3-one 26-monooxygenase